MHHLTSTTIRQPQHDLFGAAFPGGLPAFSRPAVAPGTPYRGPERRSGASVATRWLTAMLDAIDYGMLLLVDGSQVLHINHAARAELDAGHPLQLLGRELRTRHPQDVAKLHEALAGAQRGLRKLVTLGASEELPLAVAVVPLGDLGAPALPGGPDMSQATLLLMGKRQVCEGLTVQWFARLHALTPAETKVLEALCRGRSAREIADAHQVGLSTIRSQIAAIRDKTGAEGIRDVVERMAVLPPILMRRLAS